MSKSEVADILWQIQQEYESGWQAVHGLALGTSQHVFVTSKMETIGGLHEQLQSIVGDQAIHLITEHLKDFDPKKPERNNTMTNTDEKMWYSTQEALAYLKTNENTLCKKMTLLCIESRPLPNSRGKYISKEDVQRLKRALNPMIL